DDQRGVLRAGEETERPAGTQGALLIDVRDVDAEGLAVAEVIDDLLRLVMGGDVDLADPGVAETLDDPLQQGSAVDMQHWLGQVLRVGEEALAEAAGHDDGLDGRRPLRQQFLERHHVEYAALVVYERRGADLALLDDPQQLGGLRRGRRSGRRWVRGLPLDGEELGDRRVQADATEDSAPDVA